MALVPQEGNGLLLDQLRASVVLPDPIPHTVTAIFEAYARTRVETDRTYLGASEIGEECERKLWYNFRWISPLEQIDGRKAYLFNTGHVEEARLIAALKATPGLIVHDRDTYGEQLGFTAFGGHFRGHLDGEVTGVLEAPTAVHVLEIKTHNEKSFKEVQRRGVAAAKPQHVAQMQVYMHSRGLTRALYLFENKNTSDLDSQRIEYDSIEAGRLFAKAERVILTPRPLPRAWENPAAKGAWACGFCRHRYVCHEGAWARVSCRSCLHSTPVNDGWHCARHDRPLSVEDQRMGCSSHLFIPELVPGEQIDANAEKETVTYRLASGATWIDGVMT